MPRFVFCFVFSLVRDKKVRGGDCPFKNLVVNLQHFTYASGPSLPRQSFPFKKKKEGGRTTRMKVVSVRGSVWKVLKRGAAACLSSLSFDLDSQQRGRLYRDVPYICCCCFRLVLEIGEKSFIWRIPYYSIPVWFFLFYFVLSCSFIVGDFLCRWTFMFGGGGGREGWGSLLLISLCHSIFNACENLVKSLSTSLSHRSTYLVFWSPI